MVAFRDADGAEQLEAPTRLGRLRLDVAPRHVGLAVGPLAVTITDEFVTLEEQARRRPRRRSLRRTGPLVVARDVPHEDLGLWMVVGTAGGGGAMRRVFGVAPAELFAEDGLTALRALDRLSARLRQALSRPGDRARRAYEFGRGVDKVLVVDEGDALVVYARRLFGDVARRVGEVWADGTVVLPGRRDDRRVKVHHRFGFAVTGDHVRFLSPDGDDLGRLSLPWITSEDRLELARRFGEFIDGGRALDEPSAPGRARRDGRRLLGRAVGRMRLHRLVPWKLR